TVAFRATDVEGNVSEVEEISFSIASEEPDPVEQLTETSVVTRCVVGKTVLVASVTNVADEALDIDVATPFGTRSAEGLAAGATKSFAFTTRAVDIVGGEVEVSSVSGSGLEGSEQAAYGASSCS